MALAVYALNVAVEIGIDFLQQPKSPEQGAMVLVILRGGREYLSDQSYIPRYPLDGKD